LNRNGDRRISIDRDGQVLVGQVLIGRVLAVQDVEQPVQFIPDYFLLTPQRTILVARTPSSLLSIGVAPSQFSVFAIVVDAVRALIPRIHTKDARSTRRSLIRAKTEQLPVALIFTRRAIYRQDRLREVRGVHDHSTDDDSLITVCDDSLITVWNIPEAWRQWRYQINITFDLVHASVHNVTNGLNDTFVNIEDIDVVARNSKVNRIVTPRILASR